MTLEDVMEALEAFAPLGLAEPWDNSGLQVGDPLAEVDRIMVALDPSPAAIAEAAARRAQLVVTHHPLLLQPLSRLDLSAPAPRLAASCIRRGLAVYAAHTNLDRAAGGVNDALAERLGLRSAVPLRPGEGQVKLVVTVPVGYEPALRRALTSAGAGTIGNYAGCSFAARGTGAFCPLPGARPFLGRVGVPEEVEESRLETVVPRSRLEAVIRAVKAAHPYDEPALDVYPLEGRYSSGGLGRVGELGEPVSLGQWARAAAQALGAPGARFVGDPSMPVTRAAVCGGSGGDLWRDAHRAGAQVLLTGDVKYHVALEARDAGIALVDAGHGATESVAVDVLVGVLSDWSRGRGVEVRTDAFQEPEPLVALPA